jgi:hypothetical protein
MNRPFLISAPGAPLQLVHAATRADAIAKAAQERDVLDLEPIPDDAWIARPIPLPAAQYPLELN